MATTSPPLGARVLACLAGVRDDRSAYRTRLTRTGKGNTDDVWATVRSRRRKPIEFNPSPKCELYLHIALSRGANGMLKRRPVWARGLRRRFCGRGTRSPSQGAGCKRGVPARCCDRPDHLDVSFPASPRRSARPSCRPARDCRRLAAAPRSSRREPAGTRRAYGVYASVRILGEMVKRTVRLRPDDVTASPDSKSTAMSSKPSTRPSRGNDAL